MTVNSEPLTTNHHFFFPPPVEKKYRCSPYP
jgi:hypothetical protein